MRSEPVENGSTARAMTWPISRGASLALLGLVSLSAGCNQLFGLDEVQLAANNAYSASCQCTSQSPFIKPITVSAAVCLPEPANPNLHPVTVTQQVLDADASGRLQPNIQGIVDACLSKTLTCSCQAAPLAAMFSASECDKACVGEDLISNCANWNTLSTPHVKTATNVPGQPPVCLVASTDPPDPVPDPLVAGVFAQVSSCQVAGTATIAHGGDSQTQPVSGVVQLTGSPCPGGSCAVGMSYRFDHIDNFKFDAFGGFDAVEFKKLYASGVSIPAGATLDATGAGAFPASSMSAFGQGQRSNQLCVPGVGCAEYSSAGAGYVGGNGQPVGVAVDWRNHACSVSGALFGQLEGGDTAATADVSGTIDNEPPTADAGRPQTVECTSSAGAHVTLDGSASADPENNIALFVWRAGARAGTELGYEPQVHVDEGFGSQSYFLRVVDAYGQSSESSTVVTVVDSTPPEIRCNVAADPTSGAGTITPSQAPITFTASARDTCDPGATAKVGRYTCFKVDKNGVVSKVQSCVVAVAGSAVSILDSGGIGDHVQWTVSATDQSGNAASRTCEVLVVQKK